MRDDLKSDVVAHVIEDVFGGEIATQEEVTDYEDDLAAQVDAARRASP